MTKTELTNAIAAAKIAFEDECKKLYVQFAKENNPVKIGDVVSTYDNKFILKVDQIQFCKGVSSPVCCYYGTRLKKDGTPHKIQKPNHIMQSTIDFINDQPYKFNPDGN